MDDQLESIMHQIEQIELVFESMRKRAKHDDFSNLTMSEIHKFNTMARAAIERASPRGSAYVQQCNEIADRNIYDGDKVEMLFGIVIALKGALLANYLRSVTEIIHADLFSDFLEMANHLLDSGYKDAAAVIAGSALEVHLRQLGNKHGVSTELTTRTGVRQKKADQLNSDLCKSDVYSKLDQKSVTAWLGLRNNAAHGEYGEYTAEQVEFFVDSIRDFIRRHPA